MSMFQKSVLKSIPQDESIVALRWAKFQEFIAKKEFVRSVKEEKYQDGFLKDVFENCLGYTLDSTNPKDFNLERERKNETDGKKADGAIHLNSDIIGIIELKAQDTKNLDKATDQAFGYLVSNSKAHYVIVSNFDELRFYIDKKTVFEKFSLFNLTYEEFKKLHLLLSFESIKEGIPLKLKEKTANFEAQISKELYKDFSIFRNHLFENLIKNNPNIEKIELLRYTQKICDRIIFILFAEDRGLLQPNTIKEIRQRHEQDIFGNPMYQYYKIYFDAINEGNEKLQIPRYNGGLFAKDEILDSLIIDDDVLNMEAQKLSDYDFDSEVGVNILGHIFEQSLTDLEEMERGFHDSVIPAKAGIHEEEWIPASSTSMTKTIDNDNKKVSKRKKDGVFYTPEYITKYIVENTLGKMCKEKREELKITEVTAPSNPKKPGKIETQTKENLEIYKEWLFDLKILDPACGSGAFLNQALEYLISEHTTLQNDLALMGDLFASYQVEESVLEHNLYGVDINEDAVEIAKLSLWLRTAKRGQPLTKLADKIICANSLLNMPFDEGSFDVVIGNPPYVRQEAIKELKPQLQEKYETYTGTADLFVYFYELGIRMLKPNGLKGFICSNKFFRAKYGENLRKYILDNISIEEIADFNGVKVFEDATVDSAITVFKKQKPNKHHQFKVVDTDLENYTFMKQSDLTTQSFTFSNPAELVIKQKIESVGTPLKEWDINIYRGIQTGNNDVFIIDEELKNKFIKEDIKSKDLIKPILQGREIGKYEYEHNNKYLLYISDETQLENYKPIYEYLLSKKHLLDTKTEVKQGKMKWFSLYRPAKNHISEFEKEKIIFSRIVKSPQFCLDENRHFTEATSYILVGESLKYLLAFLNCNGVYNIFYKFYSGGGIDGEIKINKLEQIPIPKITETEQKPFIKLVDKILEAKEKMKKYKKHFDTLNAVDKIEITEEIEKLELRVTECEREIDNMVYKLYGLNGDEIAIVEKI